MEENRCPVLRSKIRPLPIYLRWIVHVPERFHQRLVTHLLRIKRYLHHFRMPRRIGTDLFVRRIFRLSSAVSHQRFLNSRNHPELLLDSPKASRRKRCQFTHVLLPLLILTLSKTPNSISLHLRALCVSALRIFHFRFSIFYFLFKSSHGAAAAHSRSPTLN